MEGKLQAKNGAAIACHPTEHKSRKTNQKTRNHLVDLYHHKFRGLSIYLNSFSQILEGQAVGLLSQSLGSDLDITLTTPFTTDEFDGHGRFHGIVEDTAQLLAVDATARARSSFTAIGHVGEGASLLFALGNQEAFDIKSQFFMQLIHHDFDVVAVLSHGALPMAISAMLAVGPLAFAFSNVKYFAVTFSYVLVHVIY